MTKENTQRHPFLGVVHQHILKYFFNFGTKIFPYSFVEAETFESERFLLDFVFCFLCREFVTLKQNFKQNAPKVPHDHRLEFILVEDCFVGALWSFVLITPEVFRLKF